MFIQGQWWSYTLIHKWQISQCFDRDGFTIYLLSIEIKKKNKKKNLTSHSGQTLIQSYFESNSTISFFSALMISVLINQDRRKKIKTNVLRIINKINHAKFLTPIKIKSYIKFIIKQGKIKR